MPPGATPPGPGQHRWLVAAIVAGQFGPAFMFSGVAVALPSMGHELGMSAIDLGLVETTFLASGTAFLLPAGRLADQSGRRSLYRWSLLAFAAVTLLLGIVASGPAVLLLRFLQGVASAFFSAAGPALLVELVPPERRGRVFGAVMGAAYVGLSLGPLVAGELVAHGDWRWVFFAGGVWILLGALPVWALLPPRWRRPGTWVHVPSFLLLLVGTAAVVAGTAGVFGGAGSIASFAGGVAALGVFARWQLALPEPLLDLRELGANGLLRRALGVQLLLYLNAYCSIFLLSLYLQGTQRLAPTCAGAMLALGSLVMACVAPFAGRLADRVRPHLVAGAGVLGIVASSIAGTTLDGGAPLWRVALVLVLHGIGFGLFSSPNLAIVMGALPHERGGVASALAAQARGLGMFAGMAVTAAIVALWFGARPVADDPARFVTVLRTSYAVLVGSSLLALAITLRRRA